MAKESTRTVEKHGKRRKTKNVINAKVRKLNEEIINTNR